ncbi:MAG: glycoside hydrolase family 57 protein [Nanoarchaeota archaeon]|nr:glycoside hydrolase family 57 protein [Nanoarchaeota archaeon]MBU1269860.1 glycoside hydrolase family 57 protein [Nanoarchaeota archaeon]MBU1604983.1 glycoside hydrolase family 57 protein [Nanoarchaeota archaeon]MBU2442648.1 glycoside hydrolase family 57 protein [Nanoarchaeota archaeon]
MNICLYFQVHQPFRMRKYSVFEIGNNSEYFDEKKNREIMEKVARKCYLPTNNLLLKLINDSEGKFKVAFSITGTAIEQFEKYAPQVLDSFKKLSKTGAVEFLSETYYHSLSYIYSKEEFKEQVLMHERKMKELFGIKPKIFRNTELIFNNELAGFVEEMGYKGAVAEGADHILDWRSPNYVYKAKNTKNLKLLLKNYKLSDDIAFRFSERSWKDHPLTVEKFADWITKSPGETINLFMDYETFGEHQWDETGIFQFLELMPQELINRGVSFVNPSDLLAFESKDEIDMHNFVSWADVERDLSAWIGNSIQKTAISELYKIGESVKETNNPLLLAEWRKLTTSDHFYYMCTKWFDDGDVHKYFNPYDSPYDAYINFMNILNDLTHRLNADNKKEVSFVVERPSELLNKR